MIKAIHFKNYKALRDTTLPLGRLTVLIGPNGSGKSTALQALRLFEVPLLPTSLSAGARSGSEMSISIVWDETSAIGTTTKTRSAEGMQVVHTERRGGDRMSIMDQKGKLNATLQQARVYSLDALVLADKVNLEPNIELAINGRGLAGVLDRLRDNHPERFEALNAEFGRWLPEFDRLLFDTPQVGHRVLKLRLRDRKVVIPAADISQGTLLALALLTLAYLPDPPPIIGLEEPDRGLHPRLMKDVQDALQRLAFPENYGESRQPAQVVVTTHSPYFLDLFKDHPDDIVIANKVDGNVTFQRLVDLPNYQEIVAGSGASLGEIWYSGILGGVPANT